MADKRLYHSIADKITKLINDGAYPPGSRLPGERELAEQFGVSRVTIREAEIALQALGQIIIKTGSGAYVLDPSERDYRALPNVSAFELTEARSLFESEAAALAARNMTDRTLRRLEAPGVYEQLGERSGALAEGLRGLASEAGVELCSVAVGGMFGFFFHPGPVRDFDQARKAREEVVSNGHHEFPIVNPARVCAPHRIGYLAHSSGRGWYHDGVALIDFQTGKAETFTFGPKHHVSEPIFAAKPGHRYEMLTDREPGWLLAEILDGAAGRSFLAVFDTQSIAAGPIARVALKHHVPLSFHGYWHAL